MELMWFYKKNTANGHNVSSYVISVVGCGQNKVNSSANYRVAYSVDPKLI